jgi:hypothetical protein
MQGIITDTGGDWQLYKQHHTMAMIGDWILYPFRHLREGHHTMMQFITLSFLGYYSSSMGQEIDPPEGLKTAAVVLPGCLYHFLNDQVAER